MLNAIGYICVKTCILLTGQIIEGDIEKRIVLLNIPRTLLIGLMHGIPGNPGFRLMILQNLLLVYIFIRV